MKKLLGILIFISIILCSFAFANTEYVDFGYGNRQVFLSNTRDVFHSPYIPLGRINNTIDIAISSFSLPQIADMNGDNFNEIIFYGTNTVYFINNIGNILDSYSTAHSITGKGSIYASPEYHKGRLAIFDNDSSNYFVQIFEFQSSSMLKIANYSLPSGSYTGEVYSGDKSDYLAIPMSNYTTVFMNKSDGSYFFNSVRTSSLLNMTDEANGILGSGLEEKSAQNHFLFSDLNNDGKDEFVSVGTCIFAADTTHYSACYNVYQPEGNHFLLQGKILYDASTSINKWGTSIASGSIGSSTAKNLFFVIRGVVIEHVVMTLGGSKLYETRTNSVIGNWIVGDIDADGQNEACSYMGNSTITTALYCLDGSYKLKYKIKTPQLDSNEGLLTASSIYYFWQDGMYVAHSTFNGASYSNITNITRASQIDSTLSNFTIDSQAVIPIILVDNPALITPINDLFLWSPSQSQIILSSIPTLHCGNGICDYGETVNNCFIDCASILPSQAVLTSVTIEPCNTNVWRQNTTVVISVKAETVDNSDVKMQVTLYENQTFAKASNYTSFLASGSTAQFSFIANETITKGILAVRAISQNVNVPNELFFFFDVSSDYGQQYGDSSCTTLQPLEVVINLEESLNATGNRSNNIIVNFSALFARLTGLSLQIAYILLMLIVVFGLYITALIMRLNNYLALAVDFIIFVLMLIIGTLTGILGTGIIITLVILGIVMIGLYIRGIMTGQSQQGQ